MNKNLIRKRIVRKWERFENNDVIREVMSLLKLYVKFFIENYGVKYYMKIM
jgi:hypothetical protein